MKKLTALLLVFSLCISLAACGGTGNPDHDYVLSLMEKGDYDMAIKVLENLKGQSSTAAEPEPTTDPIPTMEAAEEITEQVITFSSMEQLTIDTVRQFMSDKGNALVQKFKDTVGTEPRAVTVTHAMEYRLGNCDGNGGVSHCLLVFLSIDIAGDGWCNDNLQLLLDMDTQKCYDSTEIDWDLISACNGMPTNEEEFNMIALNSYHSFITYNAELLMADSEIREPLTESALIVINEALKQA